MAQIAHPHPHVPTPLAGHEHRRLIVGGVIALLALVAVVVVIAIAGNGGGGGGAVVSTTPIGTGFAGAPTADMPYAVSQAFRPEVRPSGSLTTNVYGVPRYEAGPTAGTAAAIRQLFGSQKVVNAGPASGTPSAVSQAFAGR